MEDSRYQRTKIFLIASVVFLVAAFSMYLIYQSAGQASEPKVFTVFLEEGKGRTEISRKVGAELGWAEAEEERFVKVFRDIKWDAFNQDLLLLFKDEFSWRDVEKEIFLTHSSEFMNFNPDILEYIYVSDEYKLNERMSPSQVAEVFVERVKVADVDLMVFLDENISVNLREELNRFVKSKTELLPDLIPLPPQDIGIRHEGGRTLLVFSTTYYNIGLGNLELVADPETAGISEDIERIVFQRIHRLDGGYTDVPAGTFEWHEEHLHYHFSDFVEYRLESVDEYGVGQEVLLGEKATYCVRDITQINLDDRDSQPATFLICGKERQGITVGWGDTYFHTYASQNFDITNLSSGTYRLSFHVNTDDRLKEITKENNESNALIKIDKEKSEVIVLEIEPRVDMDFEHVHIKQQL